MPNLSAAQASIIKQEPSGSKVISGIKLTITLCSSCSPSSSIYWPPSSLTISLTLSKLTFNRGTLSNLPSLQRRPKPQPFLPCLVSPWTDGVKPAALISRQAKRISYSPIVCAAALPEPKAALPKTPPKIFGALNLICVSFGFRPSPQGPKPSASTGTSLSRLPSLTSQPCRTKSSNIDSYSVILIFD